MVLSRPCPSGICFASVPSGTPGATAEEAQLCTQYLIVSKFASVTSLSRRVYLWTLIPSICGLHRPDRAQTTSTGGRCTQLLLAFSRYQHAARTAAPRRRMRFARSSATVAHFETTLKLHKVPAAAQWRVRTGGTSASFAGHWTEAGCYDSGRDAHGKTFV